MYGTGWASLSVLGGLLIGGLLYWMDNRRYNKLGAANVMASPVKVWRNIMRVVLITALIWVGLPLLFCVWSIYVAGFVGCVGVRLGLGLRDRRLNVDPRDRYTAWNAEHFRPV
jgi:hypothetical protein